MNTKMQVEKILNMKNLVKIKDLADLLNIEENVISGWIFRNNISKDGWHRLKGVGITKEMVLGGSQNISESFTPTPAISPPTDCEKISAEMETVRGMMEFYRSELEKAKNEIIALYKDKVDLKEQVARLEADARQPAGRSMVERGNTANASDLQKVTA